MRLIFWSSPISATHHHRHYRFSSSSPPEVCGPFRRRPMATLRHHRRKDKIVVIMGATGTGKSSLSVDLAAVFPAEIVNSDKIQVYHGLDITTNKIPISDRRSVPHHLLGDFHGEVSPADYRAAAAVTVSSIASRRRLPLLVGGSNSFIHAFLAGRFDPAADVFSGSGQVESELRYDCCFIWVDVSFSVLVDYLDKRVDDMLDSGMFEELAEFYDSADTDSAARIGLRKAIGVPEFNKYFRKYPPSVSRVGPGADPLRARAYEDAVREIKENTRQLVKRQLGKIQRLKGAGWGLQRLDATEAFKSVMVADSEKRRSEIWEAMVLKPSVKIVRRFLDE